MIIKMLMALVKVIFMMIFFPIVLLLSLFNNDKDTKHKKVKKQAKKDDLTWIDRLEELDALIED